RDLCRSSAAAEDQPGRTDHVQRNTASDPLIKRGAFFDVHLARQTQLQQLVCRQLAATFSHCHHDTIDVFSLNDGVELFSHANHAWIDETLAEQVSVCADKADYAIAGIRTVQYLASNFHCQLAGANDQDALAKIRMAQQPVNRDAPPDHQRERNWK